VRDRRLDTTERVSLSSSGAQDDGESSAPTISDDGRFVAFMSDAANLVPGDTNGTTDVFVRDREAGTTVRASVASSGLEADGASTYPFVSGDGRFVAFASTATNLVPNDTNGAEDVFVRDLLLGTTARCQRRLERNAGRRRQPLPLGLAHRQVHRVRERGAASSRASGRTHGSTSSIAKGAPISRPPAIPDPAASSRVRAGTRRAERLAAATTPRQPAERRS
jgi:Tol biopolymer transport system component